MMYNGRNLNQRKELFQRIQALESQRREALKNIPDSISDDEYEDECDRIDCKYDTRPLALKMLALEYPTSRNEWFKQFVESFGICESRRITRKQGAIFAKYSEMAHEHTSGRGAEYYVNVGNLFIKTMLFTEHEPAYITIRAI